MVLAIAACEDMDIVHSDVRTAFLNGHLQKEIYLEQPKGFDTGDQLVCKLNKSIYGSKQVSRSWNDCFTSFLVRYGLNAITEDSCVLVERNEEGKAILIIALYVDDGLVCSSNRMLLKSVIAYLESSIEITTMDPNCFVGLQIYRDRSRRLMFINQSYYLEEVLKRFNLHNAKIASTPMESNQKLCKGGISGDDEQQQIKVPYREAIGSLIYASNATRPDISFAVGKLASYSDCVKPAHWAAVKRVFCYLKGTLDRGLLFEGKGLSLV